MIHALWLSAYQEFDKFALTSEALLAKVRYQDFGPLISDRISHPFGWYLQGTYRPNKTIETFLRYDLSYLNRRDRAGRAFALETGKPAHGAFAKDWTIGVRYHFTPKMSLSAELHAVDGTVWLPVTDNPIPADTRQRWNLFATQFSYTW